MLPPKIEIPEQMRIAADKSVSQARKAVEQLLDATSTLTLATGIVNIWSADADVVAPRTHGWRVPIPDGSCSVSVPGTASRWARSTSSRTPRWSATSTSWTPMAFP